MAKLRRIFITLLLAVIFVLGIYLGVKFAGSHSSVKTYDTPAIIKQVQTLSQLVTVQYVIEKVEVLEVPSESTLGKMFAGENRVLLLAHGIVQAGIDFTRLKPDDLKISGKKIVIQLPPAQITAKYLDDKQTKVIDRTTGFLRAFDKDLEQTARQNAVDDIQRAARTCGILNDANERAKTQLEHLFHQLGFEEVEVNTR